MHAALPRSPNFRPLKMYAQLWPVDAVKSDPVTPPEMRLTNTGQRHLIVSLLSSIPPSD